MTENQHIVFVYGTLMQGERNHDRFLSGNRATFVGEATTLDHGFMMVVTPSRSSPGRDTPSVFPQKEGHKLRGQVFAVNSERLAKLDDLEKEYQRSMIQLDNTMQAWIYQKPKEHLKAFSANSTHLHFDKASNTIEWREESPMSTTDKAPLG